MENVPELESEKVFADFVSILKELNYYVDWNIVRNTAFLKIEKDWFYWLLTWEK